MMESKNYFKTLCDSDLDLSAIGFGDNLMIDYNQATSEMRISVFSDGHWRGETTMFLKDVDWR